MKIPAPLAGLDLAGLLKQGLADDTFLEGVSSSFRPPSMEELAQLFPQFEILALIGQGGMGAVYKVRQKELDRIVALKILPQGIGQSVEFSNRFTREARALAKLNHPSIVTLHEFGQQDGLYYILMEFVDGVNLAQLMKTERISPREAMAIVPQICDALQYAHDQGIVHRDIKPENILLDRVGRVKVADFGISKVVAAVSDRRADENDGQQGLQTDATMAGKIIGTPQYMAPEQIEHPSDVDHRADIYALGVVFYQMLTGELPGKDLQAPLRKVHIDVRLDEIVLKALERNPEQRYQQASMMRTRVDDLGVMDTRSPSAKKRPPGQWMAIGCAAVLLLGLAFWMIRSALDAVTPVNRNPRMNYDRQLVTSVEASDNLPDREVTEYDWQDLSTEGRLVDGIIEREDGRSVLKVENLKNSPMQARLLIIENPGIEAMKYAVSGEIRYENVQGSAYLEMWSIFPEGRYFSRSLGDPHAGPMSPLVGTSDWRKFILPFDRRGSTSAPIRIEVNLVLPGRGSVLLGPLALIEIPTDTTAHPLEERTASAHQKNKSGKFTSLAESFVDLALEASEARLTYLEDDPVRVAVEGKLNEFIAVHPDFPNEESRQIVVLRQVDLLAEINKLSTKFGIEYPEIVALNRKMERLAMLPEIGEQQLEAEAMEKIFPQNLSQGNRLAIRLVSPEDAEAEVMKIERNAGEFQEIRVSNDVIVCDKHIRAVGSTQEGETANIDITLNEVGAKRLGEATKAGHGTLQLALVVDGKLESAPIIMNQLGRNFQISGKKNTTYYFDFLKSLPIWDSQKNSLEAASWLVGIDEGRYAESHASSSMSLRKRFSEGTWGAMLAHFRKPLGMVTSRGPKKYSEAKAANGTAYRLMLFETHFMHKRDAVETVAFVKEKDGDWKAAGYFIR